MSALSFQMPAGACNAHLHIIDPAFPNDGKAAAQIGTVASYRKLAGELSLPRAVFVQAKQVVGDKLGLTAWYLRWTTPAWWTRLKNLAGKTAAASPS